MGNVIHLGERSNNSAIMTVEQVLQLCIDERAAGKLPGSKAIVIVLDSGPEQNAYDRRYRCADMKRSEIVALLEVASDEFKAQLRNV